MATLALNSGQQDMPSHPPTTWSKIEALNNEDLAAFVFAAARMEGDFCRGIRVFNTSPVVLAKFGIDLKPEYHLYRHAFERVPSDATIVVPRPMGIRRVRGRFGWKDCLFMELIPGQLASSIDLSSSQFDKIAHALHTLHTLTIDQRLERPAFAFDHPLPHPKIPDEFPFLRGWNRRPFSSINDLATRVALPEGFKNERLGVCHLDPSLNNFLFLPDERIAILDFGSPTGMYPLVLMHAWLRRKLNDGGPCDVFDRGLALALEKLDGVCQSEVEVISGISKRMVERKYEMETRKWSQWLVEITSVGIGGIATTSYMQTGSRTIR